jgi:hypothetical protein
MVPVSRTLRFVAAWHGNSVSRVGGQRHLVTYRALLERLQLPTPAMQTLTAALEHLAAIDARAEQPLRSALVISQGASRLPRTGFFECVERIGRFSGPSDGIAAASWHASEVARVFEFDYPQPAKPE